MTEVDAVIATYNDIRQQIQLRADISDDGTLREEVFTRWAIDLLEENGEVGGGECSAYSAPRIGKVSGYWVDPDMGRLFVFVSRYSGLASPPRMSATETSGLVNGVVWGGIAGSRSHPRASSSGKWLPVSISRGYQPG
jgi:hypothetical protein